jgi:hypothetical protein
MAVNPPIARPICGAAMAGRSGVSPPEVLE